MTNRNSRPTYISFFHGVGGMSDGAKQANWRPALATDNWPVSKHFHLMNYPNEKFLEIDFENLSKDLILKSVSEEDRDIILKGGLDCIVSGSPCQGMSEANMNRDQYDNRNYLMLQQIILAAELNPRVMWFEQVPGLLDPVMNQLKAEVMAVLKSLTNYTFALRVLNAVSYHSNQSRKRVTIIMVRKDVGSPSFPRKNKIDLRKQSVGAVLDGIVEFKRKKGAAVQNAFENIAPTLVASNEGMQVSDGFEWRPLNVNERLRLSNLSQHKFDGISDVDTVRLVGNMVQIPFAKAIMNHIHQKILIPYYKNNKK